MLLVSLADGTQDSYMFTYIICFSGPVMSCDWLSDGQKLVTASWDHTAKLWDFKTAQVILSLEGTHVHQIP